MYTEKMRAALLYLKKKKPELTVQQYRTIKGQILAGDEDGARRQRHALRELTDDVADIEEHLVRHAVLPQLSVDKASDG